jgi:hypothetical protein
MAGVKPVIICEEDDEVHPAGTGQLSNLRQQPASQATRPLGSPDAQVNNAERPQDIAADPDYPQFHAYLARQFAARHRQITEMGRELEVGPAGIPGKAHLHQRLHLMREIRRNLGLCYTGNCRRLAATALGFHAWTLPASPLSPALGSASRHRGPQPYQALRGKRPA